MLLLVEMVLDLELICPRFESAVKNSNPDLADLSSVVTTTWISTTVVATTRMIVRALRLDPRQHVVQM